MTREEAIEILVDALRVAGGGDGDYINFARHDGEGPDESRARDAREAEALRLLKDSRHRAHTTACPTEGCDRGLGHPGFCNPRKVAFARFSLIAKERGYVRDDAAQLWRRGGHTVFDSSVGVERAEDVFDEVPKSTSVDEGVNSDARYVGTFDGLTVFLGDSDGTRPVDREHWADLKARAATPFVEGWEMNGLEVDTFLSWAIPDPGTDVPEETAKVLRARGFFQGHDGEWYEHITGGTSFAKPGVHLAASAEAARDTLDSVVQSAKPCNCEDGWVMLAYSREPCPNGCVPGTPGGWK